jgi:hypothetical protein
MAFSLSSLALVTEGLACNFWYQAQLVGYFDSHSYSLKVSKQHATHTNHATHLLKPFPHYHRTKPIPRHKRQIRIRALLPNQPLATALLEMRVQHTRHAPDLIPVPVQHGLEVFLRVVEDEPGALAEVGAFLDVSKVCDTGLRSR